MPNFYGSIISRYKKQRSSIKKRSTEAKYEPPRAVKLRLPFVSSLSEHLSSTADIYHRKAYSSTLRMEAADLSEKSCNSL
jgi:hypothetical protein